MEIIHWFGNHWSTVPSFQQYHDSRRVPGFLRTCFPDWVVKSAFLSLETFGLAIGIIRAQGCWCPVYFTQSIGKNWHTVHLHIHHNKYTCTYIYIYTYTKSKSHIQKALKILCYTLPSFFCPVFFQSFSNIERLRLPTLRLHWSAPWENPPRDRGRWSRRS